MKGLLFGIVSVLVVTSVNAETATEVTEKKPVDHTKFCYYADVEYSAGAIMKQADSVMQCVKKEGSKDLVWKKHERNQL
ncbi:DUF1496 domain-containing protein [Alkalimonas amylolytica]|uniref:DUF1496 domain-containing protein n=1 Tax=Alkalimonas amylolytica TaxID=152573 RepID=A0A1H4FZ19_ALKAM|nr:DUF1496 domain-containing protein [Alkalimonas amylolytica]SEB01722.1 Protein of unknown function [Alkalimonas amylolytica]